VNEAWFNRQSSALLTVFFVVEDLSFRQHTLMQDTRDENMCGLLPVKQNVLSMLRKSGRMWSQIRPNAGLSASIWRQASSPFK
jgi:hypothetical protein